MLAVTDSADAQIRNLLSSSEAPDGSGLRIIADAEAGGIALSLAKAPAADDHVLAGGDARVFVEPRASQLLSEMSLDTESDADGQVRFTVTGGGCGCGGGGCGCGGDHDH